MEITNKIDIGALRKETLIQKIQDFSHLKNEHFTLLAVCPNSLNVLRAALKSAKRARSPIIFAATLNQVDIDGGYTGWTQENLVRIIKENIPAVLVIRAL
jgi:D-tagatose-1,6-bisphosphate aldolase subunit GatZ/KbaZ